MLASNEDYALFAQKYSHRLGIFFPVFVEYFIAKNQFLFYNILINSTLEVKYMNNQVEQEILSCVIPEYQQIFYDAMENAIIKYEKLPSDDNEPEFRKRTQANIINDFICKYIKKQAKKYPDDMLYTYEQNSSLRLSICNGKVIARFKKMDSTGLTSNIITQQVLNFENQANLFGNRPSININVGYYYNGLSYRVMLSHPNGAGNIDWTYPIMPIAADNITMIPSTKTNTTTTTQVPTRIPTARKGLRKDDFQER
jgi:hypothetical protein